MPVSADVPSPRLCSHENSKVQSERILRTVYDRASGPIHPSLTSSNGWRLCRSAKVRIRTIFIQKSDIQSGEQASALTVMAFELSASAPHYVQTISDHPQKSWHAQHPDMHRGSTSDSFPVIDLSTTTSSGPAGLYGAQPTSWSALQLRHPLVWGSLLKPSESLLSW